MQKDKDKSQENQEKGDNQDQQNDIPQESILEEQQQHQVHQSQIHQNSKIINQNNNDKLEQNVQNNDQKENMLQNSQQQQQNQKQNSEIQQNKTVNNSQQQVNNNIDKKEQNQSKISEVQVEKNQKQQQQEEQQQKQDLQLIQKLQSQKSEDVQQANEFDDEKGEVHIQPVNESQIILPTYKVVKQDDIPDKEETNISSTKNKQYDGKYDITSSSLFGNTKEERVKDVMKHVQEWFSYVDDFLNSHQQNTDSILLQLNKRVKQSNDSMNQIQQYFKDRQQKEQNYANSLVHNKVPVLKGSYKDIEGQQPLIAQLNKAFEQADKINLAQSQKVLEFSNYIQIQILNDLLGNEKKEHNKVFEEFSERIQALKQVQNKTKQEFDKTKIKFMKIVNVKLKPTKKDEKIENNLKKKKDLHNWQLKLQKIFIQLIDSQKNLGQHISILWEELQRLECNRLEAIQQSFQIFVTQSIKIYGKNQIQDEFISTITNLNTFEEGFNAYNIDNILPKKVIDSIKKGLNINQTEQLKFDNISEYLYKFQPIQTVDPQIPQNQRLVLEEWQAEKDTGTIGVNWQPIKIKVSVDDFILFFNIGKESQEAKNKNQSQIKTQKIVLENLRCYQKMHCQWLRLETRKKDPYGLQLYLIEIQPGILFNSKQKQLVKFKNKQDLSSFLEFMKAKYEKQVQSE